MKSSNLTEISIHLHAVQKFNELSALIDFIRERPVPKNILEIGTEKGGTLWLWCQLANEEGKVISIDLPLPEHDLNYLDNQHTRFETYKKDRQSLFLIRQDSHLQETEDKMLSYLGEEKFDIIFIDGDHSLTGVTDDYERYKKYINKGGLIIFHDIIYHDRVPGCQVSLLWDSLKDGNDAAFEFIDKQPDDRGWGTWGGIGVLVGA